MRRLLSLGVCLLLTAGACADSADSCNQVIDDAAVIALAMVEGTDGFSDQDKLEISQRVTELGCDPYAVSSDAIAAYASDHDLTGDQEGQFFFMLIGLLDGSLGGDPGSDGV